MIKIAITDDHPLLLDGIKNAIAAQRGLKISGTFTDGKSLLHWLANNQPDVLLLDLHLSSEPQGNELIRRVKQLAPTLPVLVLSANDNAYNIQMALNTGAHGYLLKNIEQDLLAEAIKEVNDGREYLSPEVKNILLESLRKNSPNKAGAERLTAREIDVLQLIAEEQSSHEIGATLHLSYRTIETYRLGIMKKLGVKNMVGMVKKAIELGVIK